MLGRAYSQARRSKRTIQVDTWAETGGSPAKAGSGSIDIVRPYGGTASNFAWPLRRPVEPRAAHRMRVTKTMTMTVGGMHIAPVIADLHEKLDTLLMPPGRKLRL